MRRRIAGCCCMISADPDRTSFVSAHCASGTHNPGGFHRRRAECGAYLGLGYGCWAAREIRRPEIDLNPPSPTATGYLCALRRLPPTPVEIC